MKKPAITNTPINETIANRWSPVGFDGNKPVSQEQILSVLEAARWAPSCYGDQPWRFVVCDKTANPDAWQKAYESIVPGNQTWAANAPVLVMVCADTLFNRNQKPNRFGEYDTGAATVSMCLQATSLGLVTHQMGGFDANVARGSLGIPEQYTLMAMVAMGYQLDISDVPEEMREREQSPRQRRELGELFFDGAWDKPIV